MKKYITPILISCLFVIHTALMFYEYSNYNGFDNFRLMNMVNCKFFICTGDLTTWFDFPLALDYRIYGFIEFIGAVISFIDYRARKEKISLWVLALWTMLFVLCVVPVIILLGQKYGLTWMLYYQGFITMQFLQIKNLLLSIWYIAYILLFLIYTITTIRFYSVTLGKNKKIY